MNVYINNRDRLTWTAALAQEVLRFPGAVPVIVDNDSTYPPLLEWYSRCPYRVERVANLGPRAPWISGIVDRECPDGTFYAVTDSDLDISGVPADCLDVLVRGLVRHGSPKAGLSLEIEDLPPQSKNAPYAHGHTLYEYERGFWANDLGDGFFCAYVDTTFAVYRGRAWYGTERGFFEAVRANRPYTARHLPWYQTGDSLDEETRYYIAHREHHDKCSTWYGRAEFAKDPAQ